MNNKILIRILSIFILLALLSPVQAQTILKNGSYKWKIHRDDGVTIDFITSVKDSNHKKIMYLINGDDHMLVDSILIKGDSAFFELPFFESGFAARILANGDLRGVWIKKSGDDVRKLPFTGIYGESNRFQAKRPARQNISGKWSVTFTSAENKKTDAIGQFEQHNGRVTGTFLTPYGDYRFLEGIISGDSLFLSGFDGGYALYFIAKVSRNKITGGKLYSGNAAPSTWTGKRDRNAVIATPEQATRIKTGAGKLNFRFPDLEGNMVSLSDSAYKNKVVVIQIMGSWCPNCVDETRFFMENYDRYTAEGVAFLGIAYERTDNYERSRDALIPFQQRFQIPYPILIAPVAVSDPERTQKTLPQIENIIAFPTSIFIDKKGEIRKIHPGFDGPATGIHYLQYKQEFDETIKKLTSEKN